MASKSTDKRILAINAGSSSLKLALYQTHFHDATPTLVLTSSITKLTSDEPIFEYTHEESQSATHKHTKNPISLPDDSPHAAAFTHFLEHLESDPSIPDSAPDLTVHRIVHGGTATQPSLLTPSTLSDLRSLSDLAPLHNTPALAILHHLLDSSLQHRKHILYYDTVFHRSIPAAARTYAITPATTSAGLPIERYGFHGLSYSSILHSVSTYLDTAPGELNILALHLGSGCSAAAIKGGVSVDTTMGLTPLEGLPGATRAGSIDPSVVFHLDIARPGAKEDMGEGMAVSRAEEILNTKCGWAAMTGTKDVAEIVSRAEKGDEECRLALDVFVEKVVKECAGLWVKLRGEVDAVVFAGGVGESGVEVRRRVVEGLSCLGVRMDERLNRAVEKREGDVVVIGGDRVSEWGGPKVLVVKTDEEGEMVRQCVEDERFWEGETTKKTSDEKTEEAADADTEEIMVEKKPPNESPNTEEILVGKTEENLEAKANANYEEDTEEIVVKKATSEKEQK